MSRKKYPGAASAMRPSISLERLACTSATVTSTVSPIPNDNTTRAVGAPGRCRLASARRSTIRRGRPARLAAATISAPAARNTAKLDGRAGNVPERHGPVGRGQGDQRRQCERGRRRRPQGRPRHPPARPLDPVAEQRSRHHPADRSQRQQAENQHGQEPRRRGDGERHGIHAEPQRHRQQRIEQRRRYRGDQRAEHQPYPDPGPGQHADLNGIGGKDQAARRSQGFQGGDRRSLAGDEIGDRAADSDPPNQERGDPDQVEKQPDPVDKALQLRRRLGRGAELPAGVRELVPSRTRPRRRVGAGRQPDAVLVIHQRAGLDQSGLAERRGRNDRPRPERQPAHRRIGQALDGRAQLQHRRADLEAVADFETEPLGDRRLRHRAVDAIARRQRRRQILRRGQRHRAIERIGGIDRLQLDQRMPGAVRRYRHGPQQRELGNLAASLQKVTLGGIGFAMHQARRDIAAEQDAGVLVDCRAHRGAQ